MRPQHAKLQLETHSYVPTENMWCIYQKEGHCWICCLTTSCILLVGTRKSSFYLIVSNNILMGQFQLSSKFWTTTTAPTQRIYRSAHTIARLLFQFNTNNRKAPLSPQDHKSTPERQKPLEIYSYIMFTHYRLLEHRMHKLPRLSIIIHYLCALSIIIYTSE